MQFYYSILFCFTVFSLSFEAEASKSQHRFKPFKTKQQRTVEANQQLEKAAQILANDNWQKRQAIIRHAVNHRVHPDALRSIPGDYTAPLFECVVARKDDDGLQCAEFLLQRGANPCALHPTSEGLKPLIFFAETVAMAQLLVNYGANRDVRCWGPELLEDVWQIEKEAALIPFFVRNGARIDRTTRKGKVPLMRPVRFTRFNSLEADSNKIRFFMEQGVPLHLACLSQRLTVPKKIKKEIERWSTSEDTYNKDYKIEELKWIRETLINEEQKRNICFCMGAVPVLLPTLRAIVGAYGGPGKSYQDLENEPDIPTPESKSELEQ